MTKKIERWAIVASLIVGVPLGVIISKKSKHLFAKLFGNVGGEWFAAIVTFMIVLGVTAMAMQKIFHSWRQDGEKKQ